MSKKNPDGTMSIVEHIQELRRRVIISVVALCVGTVVGFIWYQHSVLGIPTLGDILRGPYCSVPAEKRASFTPDGDCRLLATSPFEMFMLRLKVGALAGAVFASPVWLYQIWAFITPGLLKNERRWTATFVTLAVTLFVAGAVVAYLVVAYGLELLMTIGDNTQVTALTGQTYFGFLLTLLAIFGVSFEIPLLIGILNLAGVLTYDQVKDKRRYIIVGITIFAAVATPGQDPYSMLALGAALVILVEISLQFCRLHDRRKEKSRPEWLDLDDDEGSGRIDAATPIDAATSLNGGAGAAPTSSAIPAPAPVDSPSSVADAGGASGENSAVQPSAVPQPSATPTPTPITMTEEAQAARAAATARRYTGHDDLL